MKFEDKFVQLIFLIIIVSLQVLTINTEVVLECPVRAPTRDRTNCPGDFPGMSERECMNLTDFCCWASSVHSGAPWCYKPDPHILEFKLPNKSDTYIIEINNDLKKSQPEATRRCSSKFQGSLATIFTNEDLDRMNDKLVSLNVTEQLAGKHTYEMWLGSHTDVAENQYLNLSNPLHIPKQTGRNCIVLSHYNHPDLSRKYNLYAKHCDRDDRGYMCKAENTVSKQFSSGTSRFNLVVNRESTEQAAKELCQTEYTSPYLGKITDNDTLMVINNELLGLNLNESYNIWVWGKTDKTGILEIQDVKDTGNNCVILSNHVKGQTEENSYKMHSAKCLDIPNRAFLCEDPFVQPSKYIFGESKGNCPTGIKIATASVLLQQNGCHNFGGIATPSTVDKMVNCQLDWCGTNNTEDITGIVAAVPGHCPGNNPTIGNIGSWQLCQNFYKGLTNASEEDYSTMPCHLEWCKKTKQGAWYSFSFSSDMCDISHMLPAPMLDMPSLICEDIGGEVDGKAGSDTQPCQLKFCRLGYNKECKSTEMGKEYNGTISTTISGKQCQRWDSSFPHIHYETDSKKFPDTTLADAANYCRNPANYAEGPFCYTTDASVPFEYCDIPFCPGKKPTVKDHTFGVNRYTFVPGLHHDPWGYCSKLYGADGAIIESHTETEELSRWLNELVEEKQVQYDEIWIGGRAPSWIKKGAHIEDLQSIVKHGTTGHCLLLSKWNATSNAYNSEKFNIYTDDCPEHYNQFICELMEYKIENYEVDGAIPQMKIHDLASCKLSCKDGCHAVGYNTFEESCWHYFDNEGCKPGRPSWGFNYYQKTPCECHQKFVMFDPDVIMKASSVYPSTDNILQNSPERAKLSTKEEVFPEGIKLGAWVPAISNEQQWIEAQFKKPKLIYGVITLGSNGVQKGMVTSFNIHYSSSENCANMVLLKDLNNKVKDFAGNINSEVMVTNIFDQAIFARCVRILPKTWNSQIALRFDVMGCNERENLALGKTTKPDQSSKTGILAVDGYPHSSFHWKSCSLSDEKLNPWLAVDLEKLYFVNEMKIYTRGDCCVGQLSKLSVRIQMQITYINTYSSEDECAFIAGNVDPGSAISIDCSNKLGRYVILQKKTNSMDKISVCEVKVYGKLSNIQNIALNKTANQSSTMNKKFYAARANDGDFDTQNQKFSHTREEKDPWWAVDLQEDNKIYSVSLTVRKDCCEERTDHDFYIYVGKGLDKKGQLLERKLCARVVNRLKPGETRYITCIKPVDGRYAKVMLKAENEVLTLVEVEVFGQKDFPDIYGGNSKADECELPFIYNGTKYYDCISTNERPLLWCAVTTNYDEDSLWGYCRDVKLIGGRDDSEGTVLVRYSTNKHWGTVCDDDWDDLDATVVCKQLGFKDGVANYPPYFEQGKGMIAIGNLKCSGNETSLFNCQHKLHPPNCAHHEDAGVKCTVADRISFVGYPNIRRSQVDTLMKGVIIMQSIQQIKVPGKLVAWHFYSRRKDSILKLQIWRRVYDLKGYRYMMIGQVYASEALTDDGPVTVVNPTVIHVESGDLLGFTFKNGNPISFDNTFHCDKHGIIRYSSNANVTLGSIQSFPVKEDDLARHCRMYSLYAEVEVEKRPSLKSFQFGGHLYTIYNSLQTLISTKHLCNVNMEGAYLYHVNSQTEFQYTIQKLAETGIAGSFWVNNTLIDSEFVTSWAPCQPEKGKECMVISNDNNDQIFQWYSKSCTQQYYYICEWNIPQPNASHTVKPNEGINTAVPIIDKKEKSYGHRSVALPVVLSFFAILLIIAVIGVVVFYYRQKQKGKTLKDFLPSIVKMTNAESTSPLAENEEADDYSLAESYSCSIQVNNKDTDADN